MLCRDRSNPATIDEKHPSPRCMVPSPRLRGEGHSREHAQARAGVPVPPVPHHVRRPARVIRTHDGAPGWGALPGQVARLIQSPRATLDQYVAADGGSG
jgi:hypothetical protein